MAFSYRGIALIVALGWIATATAAACPFCDGGPSGVNEVKQIIFGDDFWMNLGSLMLPFLFFLGVPVVIHWWPRRAEHATAHHVAKAASYE